MTSGCAVNNIDNGAGLTAYRQIDWPAANGAVFDQRLVELRRVDLQRKSFATVGASDFGFDEKFHCCIHGPMARLPLNSTARSTVATRSYSAASGFVAAATGFVSAILRKGNCLTRRASVCDTVTR